MNAVFLLYIGKENRMTPQSKEIQHESDQEIHLQEEFVRQVEDHSLPAREVLTEQQEVRAPEEAPALFVP
jgi:hypothetical protein